MKRQTPPLDAIEAFLQAADAASFREAADALAISAPAFSRRIQALEHFLGTSLFDRSGPRVVLNATGRGYLRAIAAPIDAIRKASTPGAGRAGSLRIMAPHSFTISWLAPHLPGFMAEAPGIKVELVVSRDLAPLASGDADVAIVSGPRDWGRLPVEPLAELAGILVASPSLAAETGASTGLAGLSRHQLLGVRWTHDLWPTWLAGAGYRGPAVGDPICYDTASLLYEAAAAGFGVAIATPFLSERLLDTGRLRPFAPERATVGVTYFLAFGDERAQRRAEVAAFCKWVRAAARSTLRDFETIH